MTDSIAHPFDDELARQRRKRQTRLLDEHVAESPALTLADVVADVLAACDESSGVLDVRGYLAMEGFGRETIEQVVGYLHRQSMPGPQVSTPRPWL